MKYTKILLRRIRRAIQSYRNLWILFGRNWTIRLTKPLLVLWSRNFWRKIRMRRSSLIWRRGDRLAEGLEASVVTETPTVLILARKAK
jgi:hypothetical protein